MTWTVYLAFVVFAGILALVPGPDFAVVMRNTLSGGRRRGFWTAVGVASSCVVQGVAAVTGLGAAIVHAQPIFEGIKWAGVLYLALLGVQALRSAATGRYRGADANLDKCGGRSRHVSISCWQQGFLSNITNPKVLIFYLAVLPQFLIPGSGVVWMLILALTHALLGLAFLVAVTLAANRAKRALLTRSVRRVLDAATGIVLLGFSIRLALERT